VPTHALRRTEPPDANSRARAHTHTCESAQRASTAARRSGAGRCLSEDGTEGDEHCGRCVVGVDLTACNQRTADSMHCLRLPTVRRRDKAAAKRKNRYATRYNAACCCNHALARMSHLAVSTRHARTGWRRADVIYRCRCRCRHRHRHRHRSHCHPHVLSTHSRTREAIRTE